MLKKVCNIFTVCKCTVFVPKVCCICPLILDYANIVYIIHKITNLWNFCIGLRSIYLRLAAALHAKHGQKH